MSSRFIKHKDPTIFNCSNSVPNGYGGKYYSISTIPNLSTDERETLST